MNLMAYGNFNYETRFTAINTMTPVVNEAANSMDRLRSSTMSAGNAATQASQDFRGLNTSISTGLMRDLPRANVAVENTGRSLMAMRGALFGVQMGLFYVSMLTSNMMMIETATNNVETAQERLNRVVREGGRGTEEYRNAVRQLENAHTNLQRAQTMTSIMTVAMGFQIVSMGISFAQAIPSITAMITKLQTYIATAVTAQAVTPGVGWGTLAIGLGVAATAGGAVGYYLGQSGSQQSSKVEVNMSNKDIIEDYMRRTGGTGIKALGAT
ncbi:MAG: hypothetical protein WC365_09540 [Candidatus Babeliales bacterium]